MATIYRFIVEQKQARGGDGRQVKEPQVKSAAKKGRNISLFGGEKGGVEHNRKMRAINPLLNRITGGVWEKGMRVGRASMGLVKNTAENGIKGFFGGPALYILIAFVLTILMKELEKSQQEARKINAQNFKRLENGVVQVNGAYEVITSKSIRGWWTGEHTYNQNK